MKQITLFILLFVAMPPLFAAPFNEKQTAIIYNEAIKLLETYQTVQNEMADAVVDMDEVSKTSQRLIDLFVNRKAIIYNDLDPNHNLSEVYELETYVSNLLLWYPDGMKIRVDFKNLKAGNIIDHGNDIYTIDIMTTKKNTGNYLNRQKNELNEELLYRIAFYQKGNAFESFKIAGVRSSKSKLATNDNKLIAEVKSVEFSEKDLALIKDQAKSLMNDYINFINLLADPNETTEDKGYYRISFLDLFKDTTVNVANDIEPDPEKRWISAADYQKNITTSYPEGIKNLGLNIDSAEYSKIIPEGNEKYYINGYIDKFFSGKYQSKTVFRDNSKYDFKISFEKDDNTFKNFKLSSIDKFGVNLYQQDKENATQELPQKPIKTLTRNGLFFGLEAGAGFTQFTDPNLTNHPTLLWKTENKLAYNVNLQATFYFANQWGINLGVGFSHYAANATLNGEFQSLDSSYHAELSYHKIITASIDSQLTFNYLSIPLSIIYHSNKQPDKIGFFAQVGIVTSINMGSSYTTTGSLEYSAFVPSYPEENQIVDPNITAEWGLVSRQHINETQDAAINKLNVSALISFGISLPINYYTSLYIGPELQFGLSNLAPNSNYTDTYGITKASEKMSLSKYSLKFGISHKF